MNSSQKDSQSMVPHSGSPLFKLHNDFPLISSYDEIQFDQFIVKLISVSRGLGILNADKSHMKTVASFIRNQFADFTMNEVTHAFELNAAQQLNCDTKPYTTFNLEYVGAVLNAYKSYREHSLSNHKIEQARQLEPPAIEIPYKEHCAMMHRIIIDYIKEFKKLPIAVRWEAAYDYLAEHGIIKMSNKQKAKFRDVIIAKLNATLTQKKLLHLNNWQEDEKNINDEAHIKKVCREEKAKEYYLTLL